MKEKIHPQTHPVVFIDTSSKTEFFTESTLKSDKTRDIDGVTFYEIYMEISSASHPFFTGEQVFVDTARRVEKFQEKQAKQEATAKARKGKAAKKVARAAAKNDDDKKKGKETAEPKAEETSK